MIVTGIRELILFLINFINSANIFIMAITLVIFIWGIFKLLVSGKDSKEREKAKGYIVWGVVALAVMVSVWGLVNLMISTFGFGYASPMTPGFPSTTSL